MKIAITTSGDTLDAPVDQRFGRAQRFLIFDLTTDSFTTIDNQQNLNAMQGAGVQSAETVARTGAGAVITGSCGPKAFRVLSMAGIKIFQAGDASTVRDALARYRAGELSESDSANVDSHWS